MCNRKTLKCKNHKPFNINRAGKRKTFIVLLLSVPAIWLDVKQSSRLHLLIITGNSMLTNKYKIIFIINTRGGEKNLSVPSTSVQMSRMV